MVDTYTAVEGVTVPPGTTETVSVLYHSGLDYCGNAVYFGSGTGVSRLFTPEGYINRQYGVTGNWIYYYTLKDHLGSVRYEFKGDGTNVGYTHYYPSGVEFADPGSLGRLVDRRRFNDKELQSDFGLNWYDFVARGYDPAAGRPWQPDPLAEKRPWESPYLWCGGNPMNAIDPDGRDWIVSKGSFEYDGRKYEYDHYEWRDDITADSKLPKGVSYVGADDNDILTHMGVSPKYETKNENSTGIGAAGGDNVGPAGKGFIGGETSNTIGNITISTDVNYNKENITDNNKTGRTFNGVNVTVGAAEFSTSSSSDFASTSNGYLSVIHGGKEFRSQLQTPTDSYYGIDKVKNTTATVHIPVYNISSTNYLESATINIGYSSGVIKLPTIIRWSLQTRYQYRQGR